MHNFLMLFCINDSFLKVCLELYDDFLNHWFDYNEDKEKFAHCMLIVRKARQRKVVCNHLTLKFRMKTFLNQVLLS